MVRHEIKQSIKEDSTMNAYCRNGQFLLTMHAMLHVMGLHQEIDILDMNQLLT